MSIRNTICQSIAKQRWVSKTLRLAVINLISPNFMKGHVFDTEFFGYTYRGNTRNLIDRKVLFSGCHECDVLAFIKDILKDRKNAVYIDIGANVGHHALFASLYADKVYAFEPYPSVRRLMEDKIRLNGISNIHVTPTALGDKRESKRFFAPPEVNLGTGSFVEEYSEMNSEDVDIEIYPLDEIYEGLGIRRADLVKIDVEGFELQVLAGAHDMIKKVRPIVLFENSMYLDHALHTLQDVTRAFPGNYLFYRFSHNGKRRHGRYRLLELTANMFSNRRQLALVAVPKEANISLSAAGRLVR